MIAYRGLDRNEPFTAPRRRGVSLLELTTVVILLAIVASVILPRVAGNSLDAKKNTCYINVRNIEVQAELWYRNNGTWPATDLSDVGASGAYFPDGLPSCPVDATSYALDGTTHLVTGHDHP